MPNKVILFNDIVESSKLLLKHDKKYIKMLKKLFLVVSKFAEETNGILVKNMGDAFLLAFDNMDDCLKFVDKMLRYTVLNKLSLGRNNSDLVRFRTGIFQGDVYKLKYRLQNKELFDYFGNTVNTASRLESNVSPRGGFAIGASSKNIGRITESIKKRFGDKIKIDYFVFKKKCGRMSKKCRSDKDIKGVKKNIKVITGKLIAKKKKSKKNN